MSRRTFLQLAAAAPLAALAAPVGAEAETPMMTLFSKWLRLRDHSHDPALTDDEHSAAVDALCYVEDLMAETPCATASDWVAKVIAFTGFGEYALRDDRQDPAFWREAMTMTRQVRS